MTYVSDYLNLKICQSCQNNRMYFVNNESYKRKDISWALDLKTQCMATSRMKPQCGLFGWAAYLPKCTLRSPHWKYTQILIPMKSNVELTHTNIYPNKTWDFSLVLSVEISIKQCTQACACLQPKTKSPSKRSSKCTTGCILTLTITVMWIERIWRQQHHQLFMKRYIMSVYSLLLKTCVALLDTKITFSQEEKYSFAAR